MCNVNSPILKFVFAVILLLVCHVVEAQQYCVNATTLRIRSNPNAKASIVGNLRKGDTVNVLSLSDDKQWGAIQQPKKGWVSMKYLIPVEIDSSEDDFSDRDVPFGRWIIQQEWFLSFMKVLLFLGGLEFLVLLVFAHIRLRIIDIWLRYTFVFANLTNIVLAAPIFLYLLPTCIAIMVYYIILYSRLSARKYFFKVIIYSIALFLVFLLVMTIIYHATLGGFLIRAAFTAGANYFLFCVIYIGTWDYECPHCNYYSRHKKLSEVVTHSGYSTSTSDGSNTIEEYSFDGVNTNARLMEDYKQTDTYLNVFSDVTLKCGRCGRQFVYNKSTSRKVGSRRNYSGRQYIEESGGARHYI